MPWKDRKYRLLRIGARLLFATAIVDAVTQIGRTVAQALLYQSPWTSLGTWQFAVSVLATIHGAGAGVVATLAWLVASRVLTGVADRMQAATSAAGTAAAATVPLWPFGEAAEAAAAAGAAGTALAAASMGKSTAPPVRPFVGVLPRRCRVLRGLATAVLVLQMIRVAVSAVGTAMTAHVYAAGPASELLRPQLLMLLAGWPASLFHGVVWALFLFALFRLIARLGAVAADEGH